MNIYEKGVLFRGFIMTENKGAKERFKNREDLKAFKQVESLPEFAGVLAPDTVLVDIDDASEADKMFDLIKAEKINCVVMQTTRGKHFYFKNNAESPVFTSCKTHAPLAVGVTADIKLGTRNSYSVLKFGDKMRDVLLNPKTLDEVPKWLSLLKKKTDFNLVEGDGRNQTFFTYILTLQKAGLDKEECRKTIRLINEYILPEPLTEEELEVILRDEAFKETDFYSSGKFQHDTFARKLKSKYHIIRNDGSILIFHDGVYVHSKRLIKKAIDAEIPSLRKTQINEVLDKLDTICDDVPSGAVNLIAFNNGLLDIDSGYLSQFDPSKVITNKIPWNYNPDAYSELADKTLDRIACGDSEIRLLLEEMIGACFYRSNTLGGGKAFILTGLGANGKSTLLDVIKTILGESNYAALDLKELSDRFSRASMFKVLANIGDDISDEFNADMSIFKKVVTGQSIKAEYKGQDEFKYSPFCKLIFSANTIPRIRDKTGAAQRRMLIVPFDANFAESDEDHDPEIIWKLTKQDAIEYFIRIGVEGLKRVLDNKRFTSSAKVQKELEGYAERNNPVKSFLKDCEEDETPVLNEPVRTVFRNYQEYCIRNGLTPLSIGEFSTQVQQVTGCISKRLTKERIKTFVME